jgi:hypothetical protein
MSVIIIHGTIARELEHHLQLEKLYGELTKLPQELESNATLYEFQMKGKNNLTANLINKLK